MSRHRAATADPRPGSSLLTTMVVAVVPPSPETVANLLAEER